eukprot:535690_1
MNKWSLAINHLVFGYIRKLNNDQIHIVGISDLCVLFYGYYDHWHKDSLHDGITIDKENEFIVSGNTIEYQHAFGTKIISNKEKNIWKIKLACENEKAEITLGIVESMFCTKNKMDWFWSPKYRGHGLYNCDGRIYHEHAVNHISKLYAQKMKHNDVIIMVLDLINHNQGILSFTINNINYGIAVDNINTTKKYKLAVALRSICSVQLLQ